MPCFVMGLSAVEPREVGNMEVKCCDIVVSLFNFTDGLAICAGSDHITAGVLCTTTAKVCWGMVAALSISLTQSFAWTQALVALSLVLNISMMLQGEPQGAPEWVWHWDSPTGRVMEVC